MFRGKFLAVLAVVVFATSIGRSARANASASNQDQVCDATADYFLGTEDYPQAIESHLRVIAAHPDDALAHYHLGFAYGMVGSNRAELAEYRRAVVLGLKRWDLFLNLGRRYLESGDTQAAADAFTRAVALGPSHAEAHFNLALAYERRGELGAARDEFLTSLRLDPNQPDARNMLGLTFAEQGNVAEAHRIWSDLAAAHPNFAPARTNLAILENAGKLPHSEISAAESSSPTASRSKPR
jgi:Tfp pilus assembly protein PilF